MNIIVVEDDPILAGSIRVFIKQLGYNLLGISDNSEDFLNMWKATQVDLALIDIHIKGKLDGIEVAEIISTSDRPIPIIFITSVKNQKTFERSKQTQPFAFILKPFNKLTLQRTIELALFKYSEKIWDNIQSVQWEKDIIMNKFLFVKVKQHLEKIEGDKVAYIHTQMKYSQIVMADGTSYEVKLSLKEIIEKMPINSFIKVHRNYIVNIAYVKNIDIKKDLVIIVRRSIPIGKTYRTALLEKLNII